MRKIVSTSLVEVEASQWRSLLKCPRCRSEYLHHGNVTVFNRNEDANLLRQTVVEQDRVETKSVLAMLTENPSPRRHGIAIAFLCEECSDDSDEHVLELSIWQHKGATHLGWRYSERKRPSGDLGDES